MGPYDTEQAAAAEPMPRAVANLPRSGRRTPSDELVRPLRDSRDLELSFLREACSNAGVELGRYDERIVTWLCNYEPTTVQVIIGLVSRAHAAGRQASAAPRLERVRTDDGCYRVLRKGVGAGALTYDPLNETLDADWLDPRDPRINASAAWIAAGTLDQHGEEGLFEHLETLAHQLTTQDGGPSRGNS